MYSADAHFTLAKTATNRARYPFSFLVCLVIEKFVVFFHHFLVIWGEKGAG